jgi:cell division protein FtsI/penicillin-binding protein 2
MARFAAAMANGGLMPVPRLGYAAPSSLPERAFAPGVAGALRAATPRYGDIAGWAGVATPQETGDRPLSWFVGYGPSVHPRFAIAVVVENNGGGATITIPIAQTTVSTLEE